MPKFRIHRMKETQRNHFRWAPHLTGAAQVKPKDYQPGETVEAQHEYAAWAALRDTGQALQVGDILEDENGQLRLCKYVGFDLAEWAVADAMSHVT